jgi:hypothetical protein
MRRKPSVRPSWLDIALILAAMATPADAGDLVVGGAWMRAMPAHLPAAGYFTLHNAGAREAVLVGAQSPACGMLMLHRSSSENGMSSMSDMETLTVPAKGSVDFAPGGMHLMCMDPKPALKPGGSVSVLLHFSGGETLAARFAVKNARGR